jgi:hypothetical protein
MSNLNDISRMHGPSGWAQYSSQEAHSLVTRRISDARLKDQIRADAARENESHNVATDPRPNPTALECRQYLADEEEREIEAYDRADQGADHD